MLRQIMMLSLLLLVSGAAQAGSREYQGQGASGAWYRYAVPDGWQPGDGLVLFNRGFRATLPGPSPSLGPLLELQLQQGYAVAASSYRLNGWSLFTTVDDYRELLASFRERVGDPGPILVYGGSLGGLVSLQLAEAEGLGDIRGTLSLCPPAGGGRAWDAAMDFRLIYDAVCGDAAERRLPGGSGPYRFMLDPEDIQTDLLSISGARIASSLASCVGYQLPSWAVSSGMRQRLARINQLAGIDPEFFEINMAYALFGLSDLFRDPAKLDGALAFDNRFVDYGGAEINSRIARHASMPLDRLRLLRHWTPTGRVGDTRVLALTTDRDDLVVVEHIDELKRRLPADRLTTAVIAEEPASHCGFNEAEVRAGWESLREWVAGAPQPDASAIATRCADLAAAGVPGPCRIDPVFVPAPLDTRIRPRNLPQPVLDGGWSGLWHDPERPGEGWALELLDDGRALIYGFTYPLPGAPALQHWLIGEGRRLDNALLFDDLLMARGGRFGPGFDSSTVELTRWGSVELVFEACGEAWLRYRGDGDWGGADRRLQQLTRIGAAGCPGTGAASGEVARSGSWFNPARAGEGLVLQWQDDGRAFVLWFSYDLAGEPLWLIGEGDWDGQRLAVPDLLRPLGTRFGPAFDPEAVQRPRFGSLELRFDGCDRAVLDYSGPDATFGGGTLPLERLSRPQGLPGCG